MELGVVQAVGLDDILLDHFCPGPNCVWVTCSILPSSQYWVLVAYLLLFVPQQELLTCNSAWVCCVSVLGRKRSSFLVRQLFCSVGTVLGNVPYLFSPCHCVLSWCAFREALPNFHPSGIQKDNNNRCPSFPWLLCGSGLYDDKCFLCPALLSFSYTISGFSALGFECCCGDLQNFISTLMPLGALALS